MLEKVRNSSPKDGHIKCEIFESELQSAKKCLKSPTCQQLSTYPVATDAAAVSFGIATTKTSSASASSEVFGNSSDDNSESSQLEDQRSETNRVSWIPILYAFC